MKWALVDGGGIIVNVIAYETTSDYSAPDGLSLEQVNDWVHIGENKTTPEPVEP